MLLTPQGQASTRFDSSETVSYQALRYILTDVSSLNNKLQQLLDDNAALRAEVAEIRQSKASAPAEPATTGFRSWSGAVAACGKQRLGDIGKMWTKGMTFVSESAIDACVNASTAGVAGELRVLGLYTRLNIAAFTMDSRSAVEGEISLNGLEQRLYGESTVGGEFAAMLQCLTDMRLVRLSNGRASVLGFKSLRREVEAKSARNFKMIPRWWITQFGLDASDSRYDTIGSLAYCLRHMSIYKRSVTNTSLFQNHIQYLADHTNAIEVRNGQFFVAKHASAAIRG